MAKFSSTDSGATVLSKLNNTIVTVGSMTGCDYVTDGTADDVQIQAAIDYVYSLGGGIVNIRYGTYYITSSIIAKSNVSIIGEGMDVTILKAVSGIATAVIVSDTTATYDLIENLIIKDLSADIDSLASVQGIWISRFDNLIIENVKLKNLKTWCFHFGAAGDSSDETINKSQNLYFKNCVVDGQTVSTLEPVILTNVNNFIIDDIRFLNITTTCRQISIYVWSRHGVIKNCRFDQDTTKNLYLSINSDITIENCYFYNSSTNGSQLYFLNSKDIRIRNCFFVNTAAGTPIGHYDYNSSFDGNDITAGQENSSNIFIENCSFQGGYGAIYLNSAVDADKQQGIKNLLVKGCYFKDFDYAGVYFRASTVANIASQNIVIQGNIFETSASSANYAIRLAGESGYVTTNFDISNNVNVVTGGNSGFISGDYINYGTINANRTDHNGSGKPINVTNDDYLMIQNNYFSAAITAAGGNNIIANNNI